MTIWHYKAVLLEQEGNVAMYRFYPDHVMAASVSGRFRLDLTSFETEIVEPADAEARGLVSTDERCVSALAYKIRKAVEQGDKLPALAFFVA